MDNITFNFIDVEIPDFNPEFFRLWLFKVAKKHNKKVGTLAYMFCSDEYLLNLNKEHLNHDYYTDIITFPMNEDFRLSADVFISWERVKDNAEQFGNKNTFDELCRVMAHGLLHLVGFNDKTDDEAKKMRVAEDESLKMRT